MSDVTIIAEFREDELPTGVAARVRHIRDHYRSAAVVAVNDGPRKSYGLRQRLTSVRRFSFASTSGPVVVVGLGSPPMLMLARRLRRHNSAIEFDASDSMRLQLAARVRSKRPKLVAVALWMYLLHWLPTQLPLIYISSEDQQADQSLNRGRCVRVIPISAPSELSSIDPFHWPAERVALSGDFSSFHNARGLDALVQAAKLGQTRLPIDLYGPVPPEIELAEGMQFHGWAESLQDIFAGNTIVFISNTIGSGLPNKLYEAIAARRPVIVHEDLTALLPKDYESFIYSDVRSLRRILDEIGVRDGS